MLEIHPRADRTKFVRQNSKSKEVGHKRLNIEMVVNKMHGKPELGQH